MPGLSCPCGHKLLIPPVPRGKEIECPRCNKVLPVPLGLPAQADRQSLPGGDLSGQTAGGARAEPRLAYDFLAPAQAPDEIGRLGPYRVLKVLGAGGMGVVFQAEDLHLERLVALKAMQPALASQPLARERFFREARAAAGLKHPHVVTIFQVGEDRGVPFLAMEFLEGESLDGRLKRQARLAVPEVLRIGREMAQGLAAAHDKGLVHRDIKPANLWLEEPAGRVKLLDFGLARAQADQKHLTQSGMIVGTPAYLAPEQVGGQPVDHRCDLFSLGCVLYRLCTGQMAFQGNDLLALLAALALHTPPAPASLNGEVPAALSELVMQLLAKKPKDRPQSARLVVQAFLDLEGQLDTALARPEPSGRNAPSNDTAPGQEKPSPPPARSRPRWLLSAGLGVALLLGLVLLLWSLGVGPGRSPAEQEQANSDLGQGGRPDQVKGPGPGRHARAEGAAETRAAQAGWLEHQQARSGQHQHARDEVRLCAARAFLDGRRQHQGQGHEHGGGGHPCRFLPGRP